MSEPTNVELDELEKDLEADRVARAEALILNEKNRHFEVMEQQRKQMQDKAERRSLINKWLTIFLVLILVSGAVLGITRAVQHHYAVKQVRHTAWSNNCERAGGNAVGTKDSDLLCTFDKATIAYHYPSSNSTSYEVPFIRECTNAGGSFAGDNSSNLTCRFPSGAVLDYN
jgi:hypothetical protein